MADITGDNGLLPDFDLPTAAGRQLSGADLRGRKSVIFLYPRAGTSTCTREAKTFAEAFSDFGACATDVFGLSDDSVAKLGRFARAQDLPYDLVSDKEHRLITPLGGWVEKTMYGRSFMGVARMTILVAPDLRIAHIWREVKVDTHIPEVLAAARAL